MLNSRAYKAMTDELKAAWRAAGAPCWLCGQPIDYDAPFNDLNSCEPDHVKPRVTHPHLTLDRNNCRPSHSRCNRRSGAGAHQPDMRLSLTADGYRPQLFFPQLPWEEQLVRHHGVDASRAAELSAAYKASLQERRASLIRVTATR